MSTLVEGLIVIAVLIAFARGVVWIIDGVVRRNDENGHREE